MTFLISPSPYPPIVWISVGLAVVLLPLIVMLIVRQKNGRKHFRQTSKADASDAESDDTDEPTPEILVALLTAAAVSVLGEEKDDSFRVVSFRRVK